MCCRTASASGSPRWANRSRVPSPSGTRSISTVLVPAATGLGEPGSQPHVHTRRLGGSSTTNTPAATLPDRTSSRYWPPGRTSNSASLPIQRTALSGSVRKPHTVSGLAAIATSRSMAVVSVVVCMLALLLAFRFALEGVEAVVPECVQERPDALEPLGSRPVQALGAVASLVHEPGLLQDGEVLRHRRPGHVEVRRDLAGRQLRVADEGEDLPAPGRGDGLERGFHGSSCKQVLTLEST